MIERLEEVLPRLGHRNWIVIADSAYPWQCRGSIETQVVDGDHAAVVADALAAVDAAPHVRPLVYVDAELPYVSEEDAPGIETVRRALEGHLRGRTVSRLPHEEIIARLDSAGALFRILVLKTGLTLPYTSVFIELDCGYWSAEAEQRLRDHIIRGATR